jgi:antitoxin PrlF
MITSKAQTTMPQPVRAALRLVEGDELAYEIDGARVILTNASDRGAEDDFDAFTEWDSEADRNAYAGLSAGRSLSSS